MNHPQFANKLTEGRCGFYRTLGVTSPVGTMALAAFEENKGDSLITGEAAQSSKDSGIVVGRVKMP